MRKTSRVLETGTRLQTHKTVSMREQKAVFLFTNAFSTSHQNHSSKIPNSAGNILGRVYRMMTHKIFSYAFRPVLHRF